MRGHYMVDERFFEAIGGVFVGRSDDDVQVWSGQSRLLHVKEKEQADSRVPRLWQPMERPTTNSYRLHCNQGTACALLMSAKVGWTRALGYTEAGQIDKLRIRSQTRASRAEEQKGPRTRDEHWHYNIVHMVREDLPLKQEPLFHSMQSMFWTVFLPV
jgi:hypothetical protein